MLTSITGNKFGGCSGRDVGISATSCMSTLSSFRPPQVDEVIQDFEYAHDSDSEPKEVGLEESDSQDEVDRMSISGLDVGIHLGIYFGFIRNTHSGSGI